MRRPDPDSAIPVRMWRQRLPEKGEAPRRPTRAERRALAEHTTHENHAHALEQIVSPTEPLGGPWYVRVEETWPPHVNRTRSWHYVARDGRVTLLPLAAGSGEGSMHPRGWTPFTMWQGARAIALMEFARWYLFGPESIRPQFALARLLARAAADPLFSLALDRAELSWHFGWAEERGFRPSAEPTDDARLYGLAERARDPARRQWLDAARELATWSRQLPRPGGFDPEAMLREPAKFGLLPERVAGLWSPNDPNAAATEIRRAMPAHRMLLALEETEVEREKAQREKAQRERVSAELRRRAAAMTRVPDLPSPIVGNIVQLSGTTPVRVGAPLWRRGDGTVTTDRGDPGDVPVGFVVEEPRSGAPVVLTAAEMERAANLGASATVRSALGVPVTVLVEDRFASIPFDRRRELEEVALRALTTGSASMPRAISELEAQYVSSRAPVLRWTVEPPGASTYTAESLRDEDRRLPALEFLATMPYVAANEPPSTPIGAVVQFAVRDVEMTLDAPRGQIATVRADLFYSDGPALLPRAFGTPRDYSFSRPTVRGAATLEATYDLGDPGQAETVMGLRRLAGFDTPRFPVTAAADGRRST